MDRHVLAAPRPLDAARVRGAAGALARALTEDPGWIFVLPDPATRTARMTRVFELALPRIYLPRAASCVIEQGGEVAAAAAWDPPGQHDLPVSLIVRLAPRLAPYFGRRLIAATRLFAMMERRHPREPHYYLAFLGVDPAHQGRGLGAQVLAPTLEAADHERRLCWLESSNPKNFSFYRRLGFELDGEEPFPGGPTIAFFARRPR